MNLGHIESPVIESVSDCYSPISGDSATFAHGMRHHTFCTCHDVQLRPTPQAYVALHANRWHLARSAMAAPPIALAFVLLLHKTEAVGTSIGHSSVILVAEAHAWQGPAMPIENVLQ